MLCSGNDAAVALAEFAAGSINEFSVLMNKKAKELGLNNTNFETPHGLDSDNHYTTAYELALLSNYALNNKTFSNIVGTKNYTISINGYPKALSNTNELLGALNGVYGIKTGFTNGANRCLVTACKRNNIDIICVVLGADTKKDRTKDSIKLIEYIFNNFEMINIQNIIEKDFEDWKSKNVKKFIINKGISEDISLQINKLDNEIIPIRKDLINTINTSISCKSIFDAPIYSNTTIGTITLKNSEDVITKSDIFINKDILKKNFNFYMLYFLKNYFNILYSNI